MITYRIQYSYNYGWMLRHPEKALPVLNHEDKERLILALPHFFRSSKEQIRVQILDEFGREMDVQLYPLKRVLEIAVN